MLILKLHKATKLCALLALGVALVACDDSGESGPAIAHDDLILPLGSDVGDVVGALRVEPATLETISWEIMSGNTDNLLRLESDGRLVVARRPLLVIPDPADTYTLRVRASYAGTEVVGDVIVNTRIVLTRSLELHSRTVDIASGFAATFTVDQSLCSAANGVCCLLSFSTIGGYPEPLRIVATTVDGDKIRYAFPPLSRSRVARWVLAPNLLQGCFAGIPKLDLAAVGAGITQLISAQGSGGARENVGIMRLGGHDYLIDISRRAMGAAADFAILTHQSHRNIQLRVNAPVYSLHYAPTGETSALSESAVDAHKFSQVTFDYLKDVLSITSYDGQGAPMLSVTDVDFPQRDTTIQCPGEDDVSLEIGSRIGAFWSSATLLTPSATMFTPLVGDSAQRPLSAALDIVAHEWGHAVSGASMGGGLLYERESGALSEAYSDWLGIAVERSFEAANPDWLVGEDAFRQAIRSLSEPNEFEQPNTYQGQHWNGMSDQQAVTCESFCNDNCGVHTNSGVGNKMFYLLSVGGTQNGVTVTGIGVTKAIQIATQAVRQHWTRNVTYAAARTTMITAAGELFGATEQAQVRLAWDAVGVTGN